MDRSPTAPELALVALTAAAAVGFGRLFADASFVGPVLVAVAASHLVGMVARRRGVPTVVYLTVSLLVMLVVTAWLIVPSTTAYGFPTSATWSTLTGELRAAWQEFGVIKAPAPVLPGFVAAAVMGTWIAGVMADWAAFRLGTAFEAVVPSFTLFVFGSALAADRHRLAASGAYLATLLVFLLLHHASRQAESSSWFATRRRGGPRALVKGGAAIAAVTLLAAVVTGPVLPGAGADPVLDWRGGDGGPGSRIATSPLVDIRSRLVNQSQVEVFQVRTSERSYWRLTALDTFNGEIWSSVDSYSPAGSRLPTSEGSKAADQRNSVQDFTISSLATIWLPAAFQPIGFDGPSGVRYNPESASLLTEQETADGLAYTVESQLPVPTAGELATVPATFSVSQAFADRYLQLPPDFPDRVRSLARQIVAEADATTPYEQALALQTYLRGFEYDLEVRPGHGDDALVRFLFDTRRGYCEQFAGSFAAMARSLRLPARVAVGFTPGEQDSTGVFHVRGEHAHAWPEVYLANYGWVAFEPTPGRGMPGGEGYTGVRESQASGPDTATTLPPTTAPPPTSPDDPPPTTLRRFNDTDQGVAPEERSPWPARIVVVAAVVGGLALLWIAGVPAVLSWRRRRRRAAATSPSARVQVAWVEAAEALATAGAPRLPSETPVEFAGRVADVLVPAGGVVAEAGGDGNGDGAHPPGQALWVLAHQTTEAAFAPAEPAVEVVGRAERLSATVVESVTRLAGPVGRVRRRLDPRPLWRREDDQHIHVD